VIPETRAPVFPGRITRPLKTGRYPALRGKDVDNLQEKLNAFESSFSFRMSRKPLGFKHTCEKSRRTPKTVKILQRHAKRVKRHSLRKEYLARATARENEKLLGEIVPQESEEKDRRTITWKQFKSLAGVVVDNIMINVQTLQTSFYLRFG